MLFGYRSTALNETTPLEQLTSRAKLVVKKVEENFHKFQEFKKHTLIILVQAFDHSRCLLSVKREWINLLFKLTATNGCLYGETVRFYTLRRAIENE